MENEIKETVLFVDDEKHVVDALAKNLRKEPYNIITSTDPLAALEIIKERDIALVVADYMMPGLNGIAFLLKVKELSPLTMRLILTGHKDFDMAITAINKGEVYRFITKPTDSAEMRISLKQALDYRKIVKENIRLKEEVKKNSEYINSMEKAYPGITQIEKDDSGAIIISD